MDGTSQLWRAVYKAPRNARFHAQALEVKTVDDFMSG
jgi:hypothetical protein